MPNGFSENSKNERNRLTIRNAALYGPASPQTGFCRIRTMKVANSLKTLKKRDRNCQVVRRRGRVYVINKIKKRFKARQG